MEQENTVFFKSETIYTPETLNEFAKITTHTNVQTLILRILMIALSLFYIFCFHIVDLLVYLYLGFMLILGILTLVRHFRNKNGDLQYKRMVTANNGKPIHEISSFTDAGIHSFNVDNENQTTTSYDKIIRIVESENLLILMAKYNLGYIFSKQKLTGGTREEFLSFITQRCPNLKSQRVCKGILGKVVTWFLIASMIIGSVAAIINIPGLYLKERLTGTIGNYMSYEEIANELEQFGITGATDTLIQSIENDYQDVPSSIMNQYGKTQILLTYLGMGTYDSTSPEWTPSENGVFWFDIEARNTDNIYTDCLRGIAAIGDGDLTFTDIQEVHSNVDWDELTGTVAVSFDWNGNQHTLNAQFDGDWIDTDVIDELNKLIVADGTGRQLYFADDGGPGFIVFYRDAQWAEEFEKKTDIQLYSSIQQYFDSFSY